MAQIVDAPHIVCKQSLYNSQLSVRPSVCPINQQQQWWLKGLLLSTLSGMA